MFVASDGVRLWTQRFGSPGDPAVPLGQSCSTTPGRPRRPDDQSGH